ncbi:MAG: glycerate kinase [Acidipropionibacterium jensenii]|nr:glycerate kinase [Acidipropionibacterium jensenii]
MVRIVLAPDSFKESLTSTEVCHALEAGVRRVWPHAVCRTLPMADGGEGSVAALVSSGRFHEVKVAAHDSLMRPREALIAWNPEERIALVEVAQACGLEWVAPADRDIWTASSFGVGECLNAAVDMGARQVILGLGGSATDDAGCGMLSALGVSTWSSDGRVDARCPADLRAVERIDVTGVSTLWAGIDVIAATDVLNPLTGPRGATRVFGPQKGAAEEDLLVLDRLHDRFAQVCATEVGRDVREQAGAGAAGGIGFAALSVLGARVVPGVEVVAEQIGLADALEEADVVFTGEGSVDAQTAMGKAPWGVLRAARTAGVPVVVFAGRVGRGADELLRQGATAVLPVVPGPVGLAEALAEARTNLGAAAENACRLMGAGAGIMRGS